MKNKKLFILSMLLMIVGNILADNISVNDVKMSAAEEKQISVNLTNTENNYVAFQFDLVLPAGVTVAKDNKGRFVASITEERNIDHTLTVGDVGSNTFRFLSYSGTNSEFYGKDGALLNITLKADDSFGYGDFTATIVNPKFTLSSGTKITLSEISFKISNSKAEEPVTIKAKNTTRLYGDANPTFEYEVLPVGSSVNGVPEFTCTATPTSPVGQYEIVVSRGSITNENVVFVNGLLDVQKAPLTIKADDKQMTQGEPLPEFTATYTGFKNSETEAVLTKQPEFNCSATSGSPEGNYDIIPINAEAQNYDISYNKGILTITPPVPPVPEDKLTIDDAEINTGGEKEMAINLNNPGRKYVAFQFDVVLPVGVSIAKDNKGLFVSRLNDDRTIDHTLTVSKVGSGNTYRLLAYSGTNAEFEGNNGTIVYFTLKAEETISAGKYTATVIDQKFTVADGTKYSFDDTSFAITVIQSPVPEPITIKAKNVGRKYGDANPTFQYEVLPEGSTVNGVPDLTCTATPTSPVGQYEIVVSRGSITNENVVFVNGTLDVQKAPLTIKADDKQMTQGEPLPEFTASYTGFKNGETESVLTKKPSFQCDANSDSPVGTYIIIPNGAEARDYAINYVNGSLTITPQEQVVITNVTAGQLSSHISAAGYQSKDIEAMAVLGSLNGTDIKLIREMINDGKLTVLNIKDCRIVSGGETYYKTYYTKNDVIGEYMFNSCRNLQSIEIPASVTEIEKYAFSRCSSLGEISIPNNMTSIGTSAFSYCSSLKKVSLPEGLLTIGDNAFMDCDKLTSIIIPASTLFIGTQAFANNDGLISISVSSGNTVYDSREGCNAIIETATNKLIAGASTTVIPSSIVTIGEYAFNYCTNLRSIEIPASVTEIEKYAFSGCRSLVVIKSKIRKISEVTVSNSSFGYIPSNCTWHVLEGTGNDYNTSLSWWVDTWRVIPDIPDGIVPVVNSDEQDGEWYNLQGVKLDGKPTKPGIYVHGGRKIVIK